MEERALNSSATVVVGDRPAKFHWSNSLGVRRAGAYVAAKARGHEPAVVCYEFHGASTIRSGRPDIKQYVGAGSELVRGSVYDR